MADSYFSFIWNEKLTKEEIRISQNIQTISYISYISRGVQKDNETERKHRFREVSDVIDHFLFGSGVPFFPSLKSRYSQSHWFLYVSHFLCLSMMYAVDELGPQHLLFFLVIRWNTEGAGHPMEAIFLMYSWMLALIITFKLSVAHMVWRCWICDGILCVYCTFCLKINHTCLLLRLQTEQAPQYLSYHILPSVGGLVYLFFCSSTLLHPC